MDISKEFKNRTVLVTGANGFIGSHLTDKLVEMGADTRVLVRATSSSNINNISHLRDKIKIYFGNFEDKHFVDTMVRDFKGGNETIIFHLGAQAHVGDSWFRPFETLNSNIMGTFNLLQSIIDNNVKIFKFDTAGTSEEYGNPKSSTGPEYDVNDKGQLILHERSPVNPKSVYATSKLAADFLTMNYYDAYGLPGVVTRMFNNYGPRQNPRYVTGTIISQALNKQVIRLGYVHSKRDFCFVEDGVMGHIHVALMGHPGEVYVYGQGKNVSIKNWMELILRVGEENKFWPKRELQIEEQRFRPGSSEVEELLVGYQKLHDLTGWKPNHSWEEGIAKTIKWYKENEEFWDPRKDW